MIILSEKIFHSYKKMKKIFKKYTRIIFILSESYIAITLHYDVVI